MTEITPSQGGETGPMRTRLMDKIERGEIHMRSKLQFVFRAIAVALLITSALVISVFIFNYLFFFLRINFLEGNLRLVPFLLFFPWQLLAVDMGLLILAEILLRRFRFAYRRPIALMLFLLLALALFLGIVIDRWGHINEGLEARAREHRLMSPLHEMYRGVRL